MFEDCMYEWVSGALYRLEDRQWRALNRAAEHFADLNDGLWQQWPDLVEADAPCSGQLTHSERGQIRCEVIPGDPTYLRILEPQAEGAYLAMRDNLLDMIRREFQAPLEALLQGFREVKSPTGAPDWNRAAGQLLAPASQIFRLLPSVMQLAELHGHERLNSDERIELASFLPELMTEFESGAGRKGIRIDFSAGDKSLGALYGSGYWLRNALRALMRDVLDNAEDNTDVRLVARQMPYMLNLMIRVVGGIGQRGLSKELQGERPLVPQDGKIDPQRVELHLAYAILKRMGGNFKFKSGGLGVEYIIEIPTGQGRGANSEAQATLASQQAEQYAKDMAMLMEAVAKRSKQ